MTSFLFSMLILVPAIALAEDHGSKNVAGEAAVPSAIGKRNQAPRNNAPLPDDAVARAKALAKGFDGTVVDTFVSPSRVSSALVSYEVPNRLLQPGQALCFMVPRELRGRAVNYVLLDHRQNYGGDGSWDKKPGLSTILLHSPDHQGGDAWRYWTGDSSGPLGAKFAEERGASNPETDNLHEWSGNVGHAGVETKTETKGIMHTDGACVKSTGKDDVYIHRFTIKFIPPKADKYVDAVFSPGTNVGSPESSSGQSFGSRSSALRLSAWGSNDAGDKKLPEGWKVDSEGLHIPVPAGQKVTAVDVAVGDGDGSGPGMAKMNFGLKSASGSTDWFVQRENVAPSGVVSGSPNDGREGSEVIIKSEDDTAYVMGVRVGFSKK